MNLIKDSVDTKTYVGSLLTDYQQPLSDDLTFQKTTSLVEDCYDSLAPFGTVNSPSTLTEFKRSDSFLDDLDSNVDTTSVPESDFVPEFFDIYGSNESLGKVYSTFATEPKLEEPYVFPTDPLNEIDTTTTTTALSDSGFKVVPFNSNTLFFEDDFRYVTSKVLNYPRSLNPVYDFSDRSDLYSFPMSNYLFQPSYKVQDSTKEFYTLSPAVKDELMDKAELASTSFAQITNTMSSFNTPVLNTTASMYSNGFNSTITDTHSIYPTFQQQNMFPTTMGSFYFNSHDVKRPPLYINTSIYNSVPSMDSDFYLYPTLTNKCYNLVSNYPVTTNYCVYIGADYNRLVCNCNMTRSNGSNSHSVNCNVVAGVELSTESWPICKASQLYSLINSWDNILKNYKKYTSTDLGPFYLPEDYKPSFYINHDQEKNLRFNFPSTVSAEHFKNANNLISEITGIKLNVDNYDQFSLRNAVSEFLRSGDYTKRRKTNKQKAVETMSSGYQRDMDISGLGNNLEGDTKMEKKEIHIPNTEKVSGVWYDTNRHLWRVVYMKGNKRKTQGFSSLKLGYEEARRKAIQMRHEMVALRHSDKI